MTTNNQNSCKQQQKSRSNIEIKCRAKPQSNQRINEIKKVEKREQHQEMFTQFGPTMTYSRGEINLFIHYQ